MTLILDNDALQKLATLDLLAEARGVASAAQVAVLSTARFRYTKGARKTLGPELAGRIVAFIDSSCSEIQAEPAGVARFQDKPNIDPGEATLILSAAGNSATVLWTGDKRCLVALATDSQLADLATALAGRVVCLEQVVLRLIDQHGFPFVHEKVLAARPGWDSAIERAAFGSGANATEANVRAALAAFIADLRSKTDNLLAP